MSISLTTPLQASQQAFQDAQSLAQSVQKGISSEVALTAEVLERQFTELSTQLETLSFQEVAAAAKTQLEKNIQDAAKQIKIGQTALLLKQVEALEQGMARSDLEGLKKASDAFRRQLQGLNAQEYPEAQSLATKAIAVLNNKIESEIRKLTQLNDQKKSEPSSTSGLQLQPLFLSSPVSSSSAELQKDRRYFAKTNLYAAAAGVRERASTPTAGEFLNAVLISRRPSQVDLDQVMKAGIQTATALKSQAKQHVTFSEIQTKFPELRNLAETQSLNPMEWQTLLTGPGKENYTHLLNALNSLRTKLQLPAIGGILTGSSGSYALTITAHPTKKDSRIYNIFDPQGDSSVMKRNEAFRIEFDSLDAAAAFLAQRQPYVEVGSGVAPLHAQLGNTYELTPVAHKRAAVGLTAKPQSVAVAKAPEPTIHEKDIAALINARASTKEPVLALSLIPEILQGRVFYHLYLIHKHETPGALKEDGAYGEKAFKCAESGFASTELQRQRAISRTIIEESLKGLELAVKQKKRQHFDDSLTPLESMELDPADRIKGLSNAAHALFSALYHVYKEASDQDASLPKPTGDFGRDAFAEEPPFPIDSRFYLAAITKVRENLAAVWL